MDALIAGKVKNLAGVVEDRTWDVYRGVYIKVRDLSANGYWKEARLWDGKGFIESEATVKITSEAGPSYFDNWAHMMQFFEFYLAVEDLEILRAEWL